MANVLFLDAVFLVLAAHLGQQHIDLLGQAFHAHAIGEGRCLRCARTAGWISQGSMPSSLPKQLGHFLVALEMAALAAHAPACMQGRQQVLLVQLLDDARHAGGQVVVEQDGAGIEILEADAALAADHRLQRHRVAMRQGDGGGLLHIGADGADAHIQTGHVEDALELHHVGQVMGVARVVLGNDEQVARFGADLLDRRHGRLHGQRQHFVGQVVPAARKQVGIHGRELEAGVADVHRAIERRRVFHPFEPEPALDRRHGVEDALLKLVDRACQGRDEMWNHKDPLGTAVGGNCRDWTMV